MCTHKSQLRKVERIAVYMTGGMTYIDIYIYIYMTYTVGHIIDYNYKFLQNIS